MKSVHIFVIFIVIAGLQLFVPVKMILGKEDILNTGKLYKFRTRPIDPNVPFRGKYIALNYDLDEFKTTDSTWKRGEKVLVYFLNDSNGYAKVHAISREEQYSDLDYIIAKVNWYNKRNEMLHFDLDFDRYYMDEYKAKTAEEFYIKNNQRNDSINTTYALVAVKDGEAVLKDVLINEESIKEFVDNMIKE